jgi:NAD(P)-dependent dehydrogenase (short-subunit alcohol dehydrogenase family)
MLNRKAVWFITGCSKGFGRAVAGQALAHGYRVVATARRQDDLTDLVTAHGEDAMALELDVTNPSQIEAATRAAEARFGAIDVLVNNAGYGYLAAIEEGDDSDMRALFEANVFAPVNLIKAVLPGMRARGTGHIVNFSSAGGFVTYPAVGYYHMAKFAMEGLSETLEQEVRPLGVSVTIVEPGPFRTDFRGSRSMKQSRTRLPAYEQTAGKARDSTLAGDGKQVGDPDRGAQAIIAALEAKQPPLHLVLGADALKQFRQKVTRLERDWKDWEEVTRSTDFQGNVGAA